MKKLFLFPNPFLLSTLEGSKGSCSIFSDQSEKYTKLFLEINKSRVIEIFVDYEDVNFKFECFGFKLDYVRKFSKNGLFMLKSIDFSKMKYCVRHEWELSKGVGEEIQTLREYGPTHKLPKSPTVLCSSVVGFVFYDKNSDPILLLHHHIDDTVEMQISIDYKLILEFLSEHDVLDLSNLSLLE